jgi:hypothetical protein
MVVAWSEKEWRRRQDVAVQAVDRAVAEEQHQEWIDPEAR